MSATQVRYFGPSVDFTGSIGPPGEATTLMPLRRCLDILIGMARRILLSLSVILVVASVLSGTAGVAAAQTGSEVQVDLGMTEPRAVIHVEDTDTIVVVGDDEAQIWSTGGQQLHRITGLPNAVDVDASGHLAVVAAAGTGELIVIDTTTGQVLDRILGGRQRLSSVSVVGDTIWYAHGPDQSDSGIGRASIANGTATPNYLDGRHHDSTIDVSPGRPDQVFHANGNLSPSNLYRSERNPETGGTNVLRNPYHDSFLPFEISDTGDVIWSYNNGNVVEIDPEDLTRTGLFYQTWVDPDDGHFSGLVRIAHHNDERIAVSSPGAVVTHAVGSPAIDTIARFAEPIVDIDLTGSQLFTVTGNIGWYDSGNTSLLTISGFERELPGNELTIVMWGLGEAPEDRGVIRYECDGGTTGTLAPLYGWSVTIDVPRSASDCVITRSDSAGRYLPVRFLNSNNSWQEIPQQTVWFATTNHATIELLDIWPSPLTDTELFVRQQYGDILERTPDQGGVNFWADRINTQATNRAAFIESLVDSPEYLGSIAPVSRLYLAYFDRWPDDSGLDFWLNRFRSGDSLDAISDQFAQSDEFVETYGALSDRDFIDLIYLNVLDRPADQGGYAYWLDRMQDGMTRGAVMTAFSESPEYIEQTNPEIVVRALYQGLLLREPDQDGFRFWTGHYRDGGSLESMIHGFITSNEYTARWILDDPAPAALRLAGSRPAVPTLPAPPPTILD